MGSGQERHDAAASTGRPAADATARLELAAAVQQGLARRAKPEIYQDLLVRLRKLIGKKVPSDAIDTIAQETLLAIFEHEQAGRAVNDAYAFGIARNKIAAHYRQIDRERLVSLNDLDPQSELVSDQLESVIAAEREIDMPRVLAKVEELPPSVRDVYRLYYSEKSCAEIAELLELDVQQVYHRLRRANELLAKSLGLRPARSAHDSSTG